MENWMYTACYCYLAIVGKTVDAISGATVSLTSITFEIVRESAYLIKILELTASLE